MITVLKFGGTSVGSAEAIMRSARIITSEKGKKVVVVSAMSGITNFLIHAIEDKTTDTDTILEQFRSKHVDTAKEVVADDLMDEFMTEFEKRFKEFEELLRDKSRRKDPFFTDNLTSQGERFSSLLLSFAIRSLGFKSVALTSEMAGVFAIGKPLSGSCDLNKTSARMNMNVKPLLHDDIIPVITGFYGINEEGKPLTFGRGGSDYAAAAIGNALDADSIETWTDVDGFMSADPRLVPTAVVIKEMNFNEAAELAHFGAKVLHPRTIEPARMKHIPVWVKNSYKPEEPGTQIHHIKTPGDTPLKSVAMKLDLSRITIISGEISYKQCTVARIMEKFAAAETVIYAISTSLSSIAFLVHSLDVNKALKYLNELDDKEIERIDVRSNFALICAVGDGLLHRVGFCGDVFKAVKEVGASVEMISEGASEVCLNFVVSTDMAANVVKTLHKNFIDGGEQQ